MPTKLVLREEDVVRLVLEFLDNRELHISQISLERETAVINGQYSDDVLFLRQLILDGQWDDVIEFIQPLDALQSFDVDKFYYTILRHKYIELLCIKSEAGGFATAPGQGINSMEGAVEEIVQVLNQLEKLAPTKEEFSNLCLLLTFPRLADHLQFRDWNPSKARVQCFRDILPLVEKLLPNDSKAEFSPSAKSDRLMQLVVKGVLYESCVNFCQAKATGCIRLFDQDISFSRLLDGSVGFSNSDLSLLSWLQSIPTETFAVPFEQKSLNVDVERLERPPLETSWTEHILVTPIKPKTFPHSVMPFTRPKSAADIMSRSLIPHLEGLPFGLNDSKLSEVVINPSSMTRSSFASFHLTGIKINNKSIDSSVDRLFMSDVRHGVYKNHTDVENLPLIQERSGEMYITENLPDRKTPDTAKSSRRDSLSDVGSEPLRDEQPSRQNVPEIGHTSRVQNQEQTGSKNDLTASKNGSNPALHVRGELFEKFHRLKLNKILAIERYKANSTAPTQKTQDDNILDDLKNAIFGLVRMYNGIKTSAVIYHFVKFSKPEIMVCPYNEIKHKLLHPFRWIIKEQLCIPQFDSLKYPCEELEEVVRPHFVAVTTLEDVQAIRCSEFHPSGRIYAVGSNSKTFRICEYPSLLDVRDDHNSYQPTVLFKRTKHHKGSIYCMGWTPDGELIATGSNDKTIKLMRYNEVNNQLAGPEIELTMHDGTVRDLCFLEDTTNKSSLLISAGAGDCKIYVTDCATAIPFQALSGHGGPIISLYNWGGAIFVSGSQDKTVRFWDLRTRGCVNNITPITNSGTKHGSPVAAVCVDPSGRLLVSGHEHGSCILYDIRGNRPIQSFKPHLADIRSIRFSPSAYYLLTCGYDNKVVLTDVQGDLTLPLPAVIVATHKDKVISARWHAADFSFLSTSADKSAILWALPPL